MLYSLLHLTPPFVAYYTFFSLPPTASLYGEMKKYKESEKNFRKALKLNPQYTEAYFNLGQSV